MTTPEAFSANHAVDFRAPPPSPVAPGRRSSFTNDDVLTEYLHKSVRVPDLILPDRVFPRQKSIQNPPKLDLGKLEAIENESILESIAIVGCFEVMNHGISRELIKLVLDLGGGIFEIPPEKKRAVTRSPPERRYGFEEIQGEEEMNSTIRDESEEFVYCGEESMKLEMEGIWPFQYSNFSEKMEKLSWQIEEIAAKILTFLQGRKFVLGNGMRLTEQELAGKLCYIHKHSRRAGREESENSLKYDVIRMLIRGSEFPHALCLHLCSGSTEFHVYSKKGWVSFCPDKDSIVITVGEKLQVWTDGQYKHVIGRPVFNGNDEKYISMGFLYSPSKVTDSIKDEKITTISLSQQVIFSVFLTLACQFSVYIYNLFTKKSSFNY